MRLPVRYGAFLAVALTVAVSGCGRTYPVEGVVLLDGAPLDGVTIVFEPEGSGQPAVGMTAADGSFKLGTQAGTGALPGKYRVLLTKVTGPKPGRPAWIGRRNPPPSESEKAAYLRQVADTKKQQREWVPKAYTNTTTTPLRFTVPVPGKLRLELNSAAAAGDKKAGD
jgi:hypothetical protein